MDPKQEIIGTAAEIQVLAEEARDELPHLYTPLVEIERLAIEIARNCTGGEFPQVRGSTGSESPRVIEHAEEQASLTGIGYHEAELETSTRVQTERRSRGHRYSGREGDECGC
jgi:hypothetical protein